MIYWNYQRNAFMFKSVYQSIKKSTFLAKTEVTFKYLNSTKSKGTLIIFGTRRVSLQFYLLNWLISRTTFNSQKISERFWLQSHKNYAHLEERIAYYIQASATHVIIFSTNRMYPYTFIVWKIEK